MAGYIKWRSMYKDKGIYSYYTWDTGEPGAEPKTSGIVDILRVAFSKRPVQSGSTTGPLTISMAKLEQAKSLIDAGLIWYYELYDYKPINRNCVVTQRFKCYKYKQLLQYLKM